MFNRPLKLFPTTASRSKEKERSSARYGRAEEGGCPRERERRRKEETREREEMETESGSGREVVVQGNAESAELFPTWWASWTREREAK